MADDTATTEEGSTIRDLIFTAAEGTGTAIEALRESDIDVELREFEIQVTYSCTTTFTVGTSGSFRMGFLIGRGTFSIDTAYSRNVSYGLTVRFVFSGKAKEIESST